MKILLTTKRLYQKNYIKFVRFGRERGWFKEPKRTYRYNGNTFSFYKWPCHASKQGRLYCKPEEMMDSVYFWKTIDRLKDKFDPFYEHLNERHCISG